MNTDKIYAEQLANEYAPKDTSKVIALKKLDARAKLPATVFTYTFGIVASLIMGVGMCLAMKVIGSGSTAMFVIGIIIGIIGMVGMGINYPVYKKMLENGKQKYAFDIIKLAKEISDNKE
ncbi:MAG: dihydropteridine reductase [Acutalibacteraceae bacterium]